MMRKSCLLLALLAACAFTAGCAGIITFKTPAEFQHMKMKEDAPEGRLPPAGPTPLPTAGGGSFVGRGRQTAELDHFLTRVRRGRGGLALLLGPEGIGKSRLAAEVLKRLPDGVRVEWMTMDRGEGGYRGWRRLLAPLWITLRRGDLPPAGLLSHVEILDDILLTGGDADPAARPYPGEVAGAVTALLEHVSVRQPLVLLLDDAHRGGITSDELLVRVARRMSACHVGIIAALREDELDENSPVRHYGDQPDARAAPDLVLTVHVPPLDLRATADLIQESTGAEAPPEIAEQVRLQTGGRPQLIRCTQIQPPTVGTSADWAIGELDPEGRRVLESAIRNRPEDVRVVLYAAALCAVRGGVEPDLVARVAGQPVDLAVKILDRERRRGVILSPLGSGYTFQHDSWIDALTSCCPPDELRTLHARCLAFLRTDPQADPQRLAQHAIGAGPPLVGADDLVTLARDAADEAFADYAFGPAAEFYQAAARYSAGKERIDLLIGRADALRFRGSWAEARGVLKDAAANARRLKLPGHEALALIHLERMIWSFGLDEREMTEQIRDVIRRLPSDEAVLRAQAQAALALRLSISARQYEGEQTDLARAAAKELPSVEDSPARADIILGIRGGLQDDVSPGRLLEFDQQLLDLGMKLHSAYHIGEALVSRIIDLIRAGRPSELPRAVRAHRDFAEQSAAPVVVYGQSLIEAMLSLARADFRAAAGHTDAASAFSRAWGDAMASEALMAQAGWLLYETGAVDGLTDILEGLPDQDVAALNEPVWHLGQGLIHAEQGNPVPATALLRDVAVSTDGFRKLPRGPSRIGILATAAMVLGHPVVCDALPADDARRWGRSLAALLAGHRDVMVLAGWPAVILGSKQRYIGLACLAARQPARAAACLRRAVDENSDFAALRIRSQFDLARALLRRAVSNSEGVAEMRQARQSADDRGMTNLVRQADAELSRRPGRAPRS